MTAALSEKQRWQLKHKGYILLEALLSPDEVLALLNHLESLWTAEGQEAGIENYIEAGVRRLANLADKGEIFRPIFGHPLVLETAEAVMGPDFHLSMLNARDVPPGAGANMPFHADTDNQRRPDQDGYNACTAIWMLDEFTQQNGATRLVPGSHRSGLLPKESVYDVYAPHPEEVVVAGKPGDVLVFNGHCWHTGGANVTNRHRRAILAHYLRSDVPLGPKRRQHISADYAARLTPRERVLLDLDE
ncbi:MAG: phytanoyl-CoA dioxygenase family protein [Candidatus Promineifilaceae bacterium]